MANQFASTQERQKVNEIFNAFDKNNDGILSKDELVAGYTELYASHSRAL